MNGKRTACALVVMFGLFCFSLFTFAADPNPADATSESMEALDIVLPEAYYGATPIDYWGPNLEPEDYRDRPPFMAPKGAANVALNKPVTSSKAPTNGQLKQITDGNKNYEKASIVEIPEGVQWVQIDLEKECAIYAVLLWHFHEQKRVYFDVVAQISNDPEFKGGVTVIYNNDIDNSAGLGVGQDKEYVDFYQGRLMDAKGAVGRYVRLYSNGSTSDNFNHYAEVEVYAIPKTP